MWQEENILGKIVLLGSDLKSPVSQHLQERILLHEVLVLGVFPSEVQFCGAFDGKHETGFCEVSR